MDKNEKVNFDIKEYNIPEQHKGTIIRNVLNEIYDSFEEISSIKGNAYQGVSEKYGIVIEMSYKENPNNLNPRIEPPIPYDLEVIIHDSFYEKREDTNKKSIKFKKMLEDIVEITSKKLNNSSINKEMVNFHIPIFSDHKTKKVNPLYIAEIRRRIKDKD